MTRKSKTHKGVKYALVGAILILLVFDAWILMQRPQSRKTISGTISGGKKLSPYGIRISLLQGCAHTPSLITLRLYNAALRQQRLDQLVTKDAGKKPLKTSTVKIKSSFWKKHIHFYYEHDGKERKDITSLTTLKQASEAKKLVFTPHSVYHAYFFLSRDNTILPGGKIRAEMRIEGKTIRSNTISVKSPLTGEAACFISEANILYRIADYDKLIDLSNGMIQKFPQRSLGYWFRGLALEGKGKNAEALKDYLSTLKHLPPPRKGTFHEPPALLWQRLSAVRAKLEKQSSRDKP